jgi:phosphotransferase system enzyme I (PtsP)
MLPMISSAQELDDAMRLIEQAIEEVSVIEPTLSRPAIGIMIEVPSMLFILPQLAHKIDFVSIGTNDLTQYLLAVDRNNAKVSGVYESVHPALLIALSQIKQVCDEFNLPVSICGELAGDPIGALLLIGLGYRTLSMNTANVAKIKYVLRQCEANELTLLAEQSLKQPYAKVIYNEVFSYLEQKQLAGFVRAGKK